MNGAANCSVAEIACNRVTLLFRFAHIAAIDFWAVHVLPCEIELNHLAILAFPWRERAEVEAVKVASPSVWVMKLETRGGV
jgi:hypothetical protein